MEKAPNFKEPIKEEKDKPKVLLVADSITSPTGYGVHAQGISWSLADDFDVYVLGLQAVRNAKINVTIEGETKTIKQLANLPREPLMEFGNDYVAQKKYDYGQKSLPKYLDELEPDALITINDIQMIEHVPQILYPQNIQMKILDLPAKEVVSDETLNMQLEGLKARFKEKYPPKTKWIAYCPQDGEPPIEKWKETYLLADQLCAMSQYGQYVFKHYLDLDVPYIWHGVDTETFKDYDRRELFEDKFVVGDINRNQPRKQVTRLIEGFAKFAKGKDDVYLHLQKNWADEFGQPIAYFVRLYDIGKHIVRPAPVDLKHPETALTRPQVAEMYNQWDVNMMCTGGEGFGLPTIEAAACGIPTLGTDYTTSKELITEGEPGPRGQLVDVATYHWEHIGTSGVQRALVDTDDIAKKLQYYYDNRDVLKEHGKNAQKWAKENVSWNVIKPQWVDLVKKTINKEE